jgi:hypothetical protein
MAWLGCSLGAAWAGRPWLTLSWEEEGVRGLGLGVVTPPAPFDLFPTLGFFQNWTG